MMICKLQLNQTSEFNPNKWRWRKIKPLIHIKNLKKLAKKKEKHRNFIIKLQLLLELDMVLVKTLIMKKQLQSPYGGVFIQVDVSFSKLSFFKSQAPALGWWGLLHCCYVLSCVVSNVDYMLIKSLPTFDRTRCYVWSTVVWYWSNIDIVW